jgi:hypothetical protein
LISESEVYSKTDAAPAVDWDCIKEKYIDESSQTFVYRNKYAYEKDTLNALDINFGMTLYMGAKAENDAAKAIVTSSKTSWMSANATLGTMES